MRPARSDDGPLTMLVVLAAGALSWFCLSVADLAAQVLR